VEAVLHAAASAGIGRAALRHYRGVAVQDERLRTSIGSIPLDGPFGLGAGWDKTGKTILAWQLLGARHITVGGIPLWPQGGKSAPRLRTFAAHVSDHGVGKSLNSYGFPSGGAYVVGREIAHQRELGATIPIIAQVVANAEMYEPRYLPDIPVHLAEAVRILLRTGAAPDAISLGLSSPNTPGARGAQDDYSFMRDTVVHVQGAISHYSDREIPVIYKGDGDGGDQRLDLYCSLANETGVALELVNTTSLRHIKAKYEAEDLPGGLAGADPDYQALALRSVRYVFENTSVPIIGIGGVDSAEHGLAMVQAGASAVGINTGIRTLGLGAFTLLEGQMLAGFGPDEGVAQHVGAASA
jgi:dihydroorotate dehydrogenase